MDIYSAEFLIGILIDFIITVFAYCTVPVILRLKNGKYEYKKGHKIILINCGVVCLAFIMIRASQGIDATSGAVFLYYMVNRAILLKPKEEEIKKQDNKKENYSLSFENEKVEKDPNLIYGEDVKLQKATEPIKKTAVDPVKPAKKVERAKENKTPLYIIIGILAVALIGLGIYCISVNDTYNKKIKSLESTISSQEKRINELKYNSNMADIMEMLYKEKAEFLDEKIVFVIDGYGNYYYTYDQMETVTQGIGEYTFWAYNIEQAISRGYRAWK